MKINTKKELSDEKHNTGTDRYLITYADLITLLLGLFVILYATAQVDEERFKQVSAALSEYFRSDRQTGNLEGGSGILEGGNSAIPEPEIRKFSSEKKNLDQISEEIKQTFAPLIKEGKIKVVRNGKGLYITLPENILFQSGSATIQQQGLQVIDQLANILKNINYQIEIEGHTDSDPIRTFTYESNWHLSGARAVNVAYRLIRKGVPEELMSFKGYGASRPIADNSTDSGKALNRRVEISLTELPIQAPSSDGYTEIDTNSMQ